MKRLLIGTAALVLLCLGIAQATTLTLNGTAAAAIGAIGTSTQAKVGAGSWQANGATKSSLYLTPAMLFGTGTTFQVKDIASFSWSTFRSNPGNGDWYLTIYTNHDGVNDDGTWYGRRLTFEGLYAYNPSSPANAWKTYQTGAGTNQVTMYDGLRGGNSGFYNGPTLAAVKAGPLDWSQYPTSGYAKMGTKVVDYSNEYVQYMVLETGSGWAAGYNGYLDDFNVTLNNGSSVQVNLEPVPEPSSIIALLGGLGSLLVMRRRKA